MIKTFVPSLSYSCYGILFHPIKPNMTPLLYRFEKQIGPIKPMVAKDNKETKMVSDHKIMEEKNDNSKKMEK